MKLVYVQTILVLFAASQTNAQKAIADEFPEECDFSVENAQCPTGTCCNFENGIEGDEAEGRCMNFEQQNGFDMGTYTDKNDITNFWKCQEWLTEGSVTNKVSLSMLVLSAVYLGY